MPGVKRWSPPEKLGGILNRFLADNGYLAICQEQSVLYKWPAIVGEQIASVTECRRVEDGVVYVRVVSSAWRQEISYLKHRILAKIRSDTGCTSVKDIVFH